MKPIGEYEAEIKNILNTCQGCLGKSNRKLKSVFFVSFAELLITKND